MARLRASSWVAVLAIVAASCSDPLSAPPDGFIYASVSAGGQHTCGMAPDGGIFCWGAGAQGELGDGRTTPSAQPVRVSLERAALDVSAGGSHSCAVTRENELFCWGWNRFGQLGLGTLLNQGAPVRVDPVRGYRSVSAGWYHSCALSQAGEAFCWGRNDQGQLGSGAADGAPVTQQVAVAGGLRFASLSAGGFHTCGVSMDGRVFCWGLNHLGQLGSGTAVSSAVPVEVAGGGRYSRVSAGLSHSCAVTAARQAQCWGSSTHGELGTGGTAAAALPGSLVPVTVEQITAVRDVSAGVHVSCATSDTFAYCWGRGEFGQLAVGSHRDFALPQRIVEPVPSFAQVSSVLGLERVSARGATHACAIGSAGDVYCWGEGSQGQLGVGRAIAMTPLRVLGER
jgi:alpha-tubulin suppressor-like RCC1 family protein